jgi:quercetin dioxygenase-like cupin family protein
MRFMPFLALTVLALFRFQDPVAVNPTIASVVFENDRVRVLRIHYAPQERFEMHSHPAVVVVFLTESSRRVYLPDGSHRDTSAHPGDVHWTEPSTHSVENLADQPSETIEIEFKKASARAVPVSPSDLRSNSNELSEPVPVQREPHHHVMFENQYVRVLDVFIPPGEATLFHTHEHDNLAVRISDGLVQTQMQGKDLQTASPVEHGSVVFSKGSGSPYTHRVEDVGTVTFHVIDIELLP